MPQDMDRTLTLIFGKSETTTDTVMPSQCHTPRKRFFCFVHSNHLPIKRNVTNEISFESPDIGLLEFKKKLGVAPSRGRHWPIN